MPKIAYDTVLFRVNPQPARPQPRCVAPRAPSVSVESFVEKETLPEPEHFNEKTPPSSPSDRLLAETKEALELRELELAALQRRALQFEMDAAFYKREAQRAGFHPFKVNMQMGTPAEAMLTPDVAMSVHPTNLVFRQPQALGWPPQN